MNYKFFLFPFINPISFLALVISLVIQIDQAFAKDTDGDGIVDALDAQPDIASAIVLNLNESSDLNANGDALKKEGNYQDTFPNLVLPYTKKKQLPITPQAINHSMVIWSYLMMVNSNTTQNPIK